MKLLMQSGGDIVTRQLVLTREGKLGASADVNGDDEIGDDL